MATETKNYGFIKPDSHEFYDRNIDNENLDKIDEELKRLEDAAGNLDDLDTEEKTGLVAAINELKTQIGNLTNLETEEKASLVNSVNEIYNMVSTHSADYTLFKEETENTLNEVETKFDNLKQYGSDKKEMLETTIIAKEGIVSKQGQIATFDELNSGIESIPTGDYAIGDEITDTTLKTLAVEGDEIWTISKTFRRIALDEDNNIYAVQSHSTVTPSLVKLDPNGNEIWGNNDVSYANNVYVDKEGFIYVAHSITGGNTKSIRKLDPSGNEIWSKTDVTTHANTVKADDLGNVYCAYDAEIGYKSVRKLDPNGNEIWSVTNQHKASDIAFDTEGNTYVSFNTNNAANFKVAKYDLNGNMVWGLLDNYTARNIIIDSDGYVYVTYSNNSDSVRKLNPLDGSTIWAKSEYGSNRAITLDEADNIYIIQCLNTSGRVIGKFDKNGNQIWVGLNLFYYAEELKAQKNGVLVALYQNNMRKLYGAKKYEIQR